MNRLENFGLLSLDNNNNLVLLDKKILSKINYIDNTSNSKKKIGAPLYLDVYPSFLCNFNCLFCYNQFFDNTYKIMSKRTVDSIIKYSISKGIYQINILGGEPFHPKNINIVKYIIKEAYKNNIQVDISTNMYYINSKIVSFCRKYKVIFNISLLGLNNDTSKYNANINFSYDVTDKIDKYLNGKIKFGISTPILKNNLGDIFNVCDYINNLKDCVWVLRYVTSKDNFEQNIKLRDFFNVSKKLIERSNKKIYFDAPFSYKYLNVSPPKNILDNLQVGCKAGYNKLEIFPNGDIYTCVLLKNYSKPIGNINYKFNFTKVKHYKDSKLYQICNNLKCKYNSFCTGCPGYALLNNKLYDDRCG